MIAVLLAKLAKSKAVNLTQDTNLSGKSGTL